MATTVKTTSLAIEARSAEESAGAGRLRGFLRRFAKNKGALVSALILLLFIIVSLNVVGSRLAPFDPTKILAGPKLTGPSRAHLFGTDQLGRDVFSRTIYGGRLTLSSSLLGVVLAAVVGI